MMKTLPLKILDVPVLVLSAAITIFIGAAVYSGESASSRVVVRSPGRTWIFPLDAEEELVVAGSIGDTVVRIGEGRAAIVASPCAGQTCVAAGHIGKNGQWAACLPNRVFLLIEGTEGSGDVDAASW